MEFDLTAGDSDDEPTVPTTIGAVPPFPTWVDDSCQTLESQPSTPFVGGATCCEEEFGTSSPESTRAIQWTERFQSSEILDALEQDLPVTMPDSDSQFSRHVLCEAHNTIQRSSRRLVLYCDPTQEHMIPWRRRPKTASQVREQRITHDTHTDGGCGAHGQCGQCCHRGGGGHSR